MSRPLQTGDHVIISFHGIRDLVYTVLSVDTTGIYIHPLNDTTKVSLLIPSPTPPFWKISGTDVNFGIRFEAAPSIEITTEPITLIPIFTGISELDIGILNELDDVSLTQACRINQYTAELCRDDNLWRRRVEDTYLDLTPSKRPEETWKDFYTLIRKIPNNTERLIKEDRTTLLRHLITKHLIQWNIHDVESALSYGKIDILNMIKSDLVDPTYLNDTDTDIFDYNRMDIMVIAEWVVRLDNAILLLEWLDRDAQQIDMFFFYEAMEAGRMDILTWIHNRAILKRETIDVYEESESWTDALESVLQNDYLEMYKWLDENEFSFYEDEGFDSLQEFEENQAAIAFQADSQKIIEWFMSRGIFPKIGVNDVDTLNHMEKRGAQFDYRMADYALEKININVLNWLKERGIQPSSDGVSQAIQYGRIGALNWLEQQGIHLSTIEMDIAAMHNQITVLDWGAERDILPGFGGADLAVKERHIDILNWMVKKGIVPSQVGANEAMNNNDERLVTWMVSFGVYPDQNRINWVARQNPVGILQTLGDSPQPVFPDAQGVSWAAEFAHLQVLDYLATKGIFPTTSDANEAKKRGRKKVTKWMEAHGIRPTLKG